jgi:hypothetical protein
MDVIKVTPTGRNTSRGEKIKEKKKRTLCLCYPWRNKTPAKNSDSLKSQEAPALLIMSMQKDKEKERRIPSSSTRFPTMNALLFYHTALNSMSLYCGYKLIAAKLRS